MDRISAETYFEEWASHIFEDQLNCKLQNYILDKHTHSHVHTHTHTHTHTQTQYHNSYIYTIWHVRCSAYQSMYVLSFDFHDNHKALTSQGQRANTYQLQAIPSNSRPRVSPSLPTYTHLQTSSIHQTSKEAPICQWVKVKGNPVKPAHSALLFHASHQ
jgi:hypothetical protein